MTVWSADTFLVSPRAVPPLVPDSSLFATDVHFAREAPLLKAARPRGVKKLGIEYERRVLDVFSAIYGAQFVRSPVIHYRRHGRPQRAIPDGLLYPRSLDEVWIIEVKLAHTEYVWDQLMERYLSLLRILSPHSRVRTIEVCRSYDPAINIPHTVITSLHDGCRRHAADPPVLEVMRWKI